MAKPLPKIKPYRSAKYLKHIRSLPCCECGFPISEAHHVETGGMGTKCGDDLVVPLCGPQGRGCHQKADKSKASVKRYRPLAKKYSREWQEKQEGNPVVEVVALNRYGTAPERGYDHRWRQARNAYLADNPLCAECDKHGRVTPANIVDHIVPHKGNYALFWDTSNWQPLCKCCHDSKTAKEDGGFGNKGGKVSKSCDNNGIPTDTRHHWL